jgi:hypothetical protein
MKGFKIPFFNLMGGGGCNLHEALEKAKCLVYIFLI